MNKLLKYSFLWLFMLMGVVSANAQDQTLTVYDGGNTDTYIPFYGDYADATQKDLFIMPASELSSMNGATIKKMEFYSGNSFCTNMGCNF